MSRFIFLSLLTIVLVNNADPLRNLGTVKVDAGIRWKLNSETNIIGYNIYLGNTNGLLFNKTTTVQTNYWPGDTTKQLSGYKGLYITAINDSGEESDPSEKVLVLFRAGVPAVVTDIQIYSVITASATNALPPLP